MCSNDLYEEQVYISHGRLLSLPGPHGNSWYCLVGVGWCLVGVGWCLVGVGWLVENLVCW